MPGKDQRKPAAKTQSYYDFISFLGGGLFTISAGYIDESNSNGIDGWRLLNYRLHIYLIQLCLFALLLCGMTEVVVVAMMAVQVI
jgi:hypothetical protein